MSEALKKSIRNQALRSLSRGLREYGYPKATTQNVLTDYVYAKFCASQIREAIDLLESNRTARSDVRLRVDVLKEMLAEAIGATP